MENDAAFERARAIVNRWYGATMSSPNPPAGDFRLLAVEIAQELDARERQAGKIAGLLLIPDVEAGRLMYQAAPDGELGAESWEEAGTEVQGTCALMAGALLAVLRSRCQEAAMARARATVGERVALEELLAAVEDAQRRANAGDVGAIWSSMLRSAIDQARKELGSPRP
jgi:hypothetical protein